MILRVIDFLIHNERRVFIIPKKVSVKPILELCAHDLSMRKIKAIMHISRHTISAVYKAADSHSISWNNIKVYEMLFPLP